MQHTYLTAIRHVCLLSQSISIYLFWVIKLGAVYFNRGFSACNDPCRTMNQGGGGNVFGGAQLWRLGKWRIPCMKCVGRVDLEWGCGWVTDRNTHTHTRCTNSHLLLLWLVRTLQWIHSLKENEYSQGAHTLGNTITVVLFLIRYIISSLLSYIK